MRFPHFFHHERPSGRVRRAVSLGAEGSALADETEAWLKGDLAAFCETDRVCLASWMLINRLAHADPKVVRDLAHGELPPGPTVFRHYPLWEAAERCLARHMFREGVQTAEIVALQRGVLVPLELRLIERAKTEPLTLGQVIAAASKALIPDR